MNLKLKQQRWYYSYGAREGGRISPQGKFSVNLIIILTFKPIKQIKQFSRAIRQSVKINYTLLELATQQNFVIACCATRLPRVARPL